MKKLLFLIVSFYCIPVSYGQTLFTYGKHSVTAQEFLRAYNKNKSASSDSSGSLKNYLHLYTNFKLKVQTAKDLHLDTLPSLQADLQNFRSQVEENYLRDDKAINVLMDEAFARSQKDIHVLHFFIPLTELAADSQKNTIILNKIQQQLNTHGKNISEILADIKNKEGVAVQESDLGFITVFTLPYEYENIIYQLKPGQFSAPHRTKKGWHIFKNVEERKAVGKIKIAQILFSTPGDIKNDRSQTKKLADSVYKQLASGGDFAEMAMKFSDDKLTYTNGGVMPEFGTSKYNNEFEKQAFSLANDGDISMPFETEFGFHIIKRISLNAVPATKNDEQFMHNLKQEVLNDSRVNIAKKKFISQAIPKTGFKRNAVKEKDLWVVTDSSLLANNNVASGGVNEKTVLFSYNDNSKIKVSDWIQFLRNSNTDVSADNHESYKVVFPVFMEMATINNYRHRLPRFNKDFKNQLEEFKEGNMLFEVMEREVWNKASSDSAGLLSYYNQHKKKYVWDASAEAVLFYCSDIDVAHRAIRELSSGKSWRDVINEYSTQIQADSGRYELSQIPVVDRTHFTEGLFTAPVIDKTDGTVVFSGIYKLYTTNQQRSFEEARGQVINDYQLLIENKWIEQLKKQYPIKINSGLWKSLSR